MYTVTIGRTFINGKGLKKQEGTWNVLGINMQEGHPRVYMEVLEKEASKSSLKIHQHSGVIRGQKDFLTIIAFQQQRAQTCSKHYYIVSFVNVYSRNNVLAIIVGEDSAFNSTLYVFCVEKYPLFLASYLTLGNYMISLIFNFLISSLDIKTLSSS